MFFKTFHMFLIGFFEYYVAFWKKDAPKHPCSGCQDGEDLHSHHDFVLGAVVDREEGDPDTAEHQHAECQELGFIEGVRQVPCQESHSEAS